MVYTKQASEQLLGLIRPVCVLPVRKHSKTDFLMTWLKFWRNKFREAVEAQLNPFMRRAFHKWALANNQKPRSALSSPPVVYMYLRYTYMYSIWPLSNVYYLPRTVIENGQLSKLHKQRTFLSPCARRKRSMSIKIHHILVEVYFKSEKVLVYVHSWKIMWLDPFGTSSPLFFRNGQTLGLSPIHKILCDK